MCVCVCVCVCVCLRRVCYLLIIFRTDPFTVYAGSTSRLSSGVERVVGSIKMVRFGGSSYVCSSTCCLIVFLSCFFKGFVCLMFVFYLCVFNGSWQQWVTGPRHKHGYRTFNIGGVGILDAGLAKV